MIEFVQNVIATILSLVGGFLGIDHSSAVQNVHVEEAAPASETVFVESATTTAIVKRVIDGDTIDVLIDGEEVRVRYLGIDTPEPYEREIPECFSREATERNHELVEDKTVRLVPDTELSDEYGRRLYYVYVDRVFVNEVLLEEGYARLMVIPPNTRYQNEFSKKQNEAQANDQGLWGAC